MRFVIDTNILISALIKDSISRKIIVESGWSFYYPEISLKELDKYKDLVLEKSGMGKEEYERLLNLLFDYVNSVSLQRLDAKLDCAKQALQHIDPDDVVFFALALSTKNDGIWSDDKHFQMQKEVKVYTTEEIVRGFGFS